MTRVAAEAEYWGPYKTIGQGKPEVVPSLIVMNARGANSQGGKLTLLGIRAELDRFHRSSSEGCRSCPHDASAGGMGATSMTWHLAKRQSLRRRRCRIQQACRPAPCRIEMKFARFAQSSACLARCSPASGIVENGVGGGGVSDLGEDHFVPIDPLSTNQVEVK